MNKEIKPWQIEYKGKIYEKDIYRTGVGNLPYKVCVWGKDSKCHRPKDFNLGCREFGYIVEIGDTKEVK